MNSRNLFIVLATRNGERFLRAQLDSIQAQTVGDWCLLIRDDHSSDGTSALIEAYAKEDVRIVVLPEPDTPSNGAVCNFAGLLQEAIRRGAEYVFCCDQDDIWATDKLAQMLKQLQQAEGPDRKPCLVHHDLEVVGENLEPRAESYWGLMALRPGTEHHPQRLMSRNEVTGCGMGCNRALLDIALPLPNEAIMHDWWLALFAGFCGRLVPISTRFARYRQHGANLIGAKSYRAGLNPGQNWLSVWRCGNDEFLATVRQTRAFIKAIEGKMELDPEDVGSILSYADLPKLGRIARLGALCQAKVWRGNLLLDVVLLLRVVLLAREPRR